MIYVEEFYSAFLGSVDWTLKSILFQVPWHINYFWGLILISLIIWALEIVFPWRKNQSIIRKDFWLDLFYMFFNFFIFSIVISGVYSSLEVFFNNYGITNTSLSIINSNTLPFWVEIFVFFILLDFFQWATHILLHKISFLWKFHQVHHSVKEMGFAAHFRYHWMENILYKPLKTTGIMLIGGFEPEHAYLVHFFTICIGHLNHANIKLSWGPLKYILNSPVMHLYHHAKDLPDGKFGVNFGISLSLWDYLFKTNYLPEDSGTVNLGFSGDEKLPKGFFGQFFYGFISSKKK